MVLGKLSLPARPTNLVIVVQGPTALALGPVGGGCFDIFFSTIFSLFSPSLREAARYRS